MQIVRAAILAGLVVGLLVVGARSFVSPAYSASPSFQSAETPSFVQAGKRYAFTWSGGGPAQTYTVKAVRRTTVIAIR